MVGTLLVVSLMVGERGGKVWEGGKDMNVFYVFIFTYVSPTVHS